MIRRFAMTLVLLAVAAGARAGTVTMRPSATVDGGAVTLADVARLDGAEAERFAGLEVAPEAAERAGRAGSFEVRLEDVRAALDDAGVNWGRVALRGRACAVRLGAPRLTIEREKPKAYAQREPETVSLEGPSTVRTRVARSLAGLLGVANENLRVRFDERDEAFLEIPEAGRRIEVAPGAADNSERVPVTVRLFEGDRLVETRTVGAEVRVRREVVALAAPVKRDDRIDASMIRTQTRWVSPGGAALLDGPGEVIGQLARTRLGVGTLLRATHVERPVLIRRNERVTVHCLSGSVSLTLKARAMDDGREGDLIELRVDRESEPFTARVSKRGVAVVTADEEATR